MKMRIVFGLLIPIQMFRHRLLVCTCVCVCVCACVCSFIDKRKPNKWIRKTAYVDECVHFLFLGLMIIELIGMLFCFLNNKCWSLFLSFPKALYIVIKK